MTSEDVLLLILKYLRFCSLDYEQVGAEFVRLGLLSDINFDLSPAPTSVQEWMHKYQHLDDNHLSKLLESVQILSKRLGGSSFGVTHLPILRSHRDFLGNKVLTKRYPVSNE
jgi:hypothetical protein